MEKKEVFTVGGKKNSRPANAQGQVGLNRWPSAGAHIRRETSSLSDKGLCIFFHDLFRQAGCLERPRESDVYSAKTSASRSQKATPRQRNAGPQGKKISKASGQSLRPRERVKVMNLGEVNG